MKYSHSGYCILLILRSWRHASVDKFSDVQLLITSTNILDTLNLNTCKIGWNELMKYMSKVELVPCIHIQSVPLNQCWVDWAHPISTRITSIKFAFLGVIFSFFFFFWGGGQSVVQDEGLSAVYVLAKTQRILGVGLVGFWGAFISKKANADMGVEQVP